jgi:hypothetical protein
MKRRPWIDVGSGLGLELEGTNRGRLSSRDGESGLSSGRLRDCYGCWFYRIGWLIAIGV